MDSPMRQKFRLGDFELDVAAYELLRRGRRVRLERQPMDLLILLLECRGRLVSRDEIFRRLWAENVSMDVDAAIHTTIRKLRRALGDKSASPRFIENVPGRGYRLIAEVEVAIGRPNAPSTDRPEQSHEEAVDAKNTGEDASLREAVDADPAVQDSKTAANSEIHVRELREVYWRRHDVLKRNLWFQFVAIVGGLLVLGQARSGVRAPFLDESVSTWLCFVMAVILVYLWLDFGFVLDDLIKSRSKAWRLLSRMQRSSRAAAFYDGGFLDGWFLLFRRAEHTIDRTFLLGSAFFFTAIYCPLFAVNHAFAIRLLAVGASRLATEIEKLSTLKLLVEGIPWLGAATIALSHVQFRIGGRNPNWAQLVVGALTLVVLYFLSAGS
jgi:DNA-binding winged helix-turn-helix (wHTH) protein